MDHLSISATIDRALASAGLDTRSGAIAQATATIRKALADAGLAQSGAGPDDLVVVERVPEHDPVVERPTPAPGQGAGRFTSHAYASRQGSRTYKLYVPTAPAPGIARPLIVMLHGCTQNPDDFAAGTRMNRLADEHGFLVVYPAQPARANRSQCWNWFDSAQQGRGGEEPTLITGIVAEVSAAHAVDPARVFVAGLSAGAAMAVILGATYPDVFAAVGAHSGLPHGAAHDIPSAFAAMHGRAGGAALPGRSSRGVPTIVLHGDADKTVSAGNGHAIADQAVRAFAQGGAPLQALQGMRTLCGGRQCTTTRYLDEAGVEQVRHWVVHGGSHAWFGGSADGSYTDAGGPDASAQMVHFFLARNG